MNKICTDAEIIKRGSVGHNFGQKILRSKVKTVWAIHPITDKLFNLVLGLVTAISLYGNHVFNGCFSEILTFMRRLFKMSFVSLCYCVFRYQISRFSDIFDPDGRHFEVDVI